MAAASGYALDRLLVRYADMIPDSAGFPQPHIGSRGEQHFTIISSMSTQSAGHVHIAEPHDFDILGLRRAFGCVTAAYCPDAAEVFISHCGQWRLSLGPNGEGDSISINTGEVVSVPPRAYRRIEKLDDGVGFLFVVRGSGTEHAPPESHALFASATYRGPDVVNAGRWIDYSSGALLLKESERYAAEGPSAGRDAPVAGKLSDCMIGEADIVPNANSPLATEGVEEAGIVCSGTTRDGFTAGPIGSWWAHGFTLRRLTLQSGAYIPMQSRMESEVLMLHEGTLEVSWSDGALMMGAGDTLTVPAGFPHALRNTTSKRTRAFVVRGSEDPGIPTFNSLAARG